MATYEPEIDQSQHVKLVNHIINTYYIIYVHIILVDCEVHMP